MSGSNYYLLATLPPLDPPGCDPPLTLAELLTRLEPSRARDLAGAVALSDDLLQREAVLAGELQAPDAAVLTADQASGRAALPPALDAAAGRGSPGAVPADAIWRAYFFHAASVADRHGSRFLRDWVGYEVAVRNALAAARARALGLDRGRFRVARALERPGADVDTAVDLWSAADDPLRGTRALIGAQWRWIEHAEPRYTFQDDEFAVYAAKLVLLQRCHRIETGPRPGEHRTVEAA